MIFSLMLAQLDIGIFCTFSNIWCNQALALLACLKCPVKQEVGTGRFKATFNVTFNLKETQTH